MDRIEQNYHKSSNINRDEQETQPFNDNYQERTFISKEAAAILQEFRLKRD